MGPWAGAGPEALSEAVEGGKAGTWVDAEAMFARLALPEVEGPLHCSPLFSSLSFFLISFTSALSCLLSALSRCRSAFRTVLSPRLGNLSAKNKRIIPVAVAATANASPDFTSALPTFRAPGWTEASWFSRGCGWGRGCVCTSHTGCRTGTRWGERAVRASEARGTRTPSAEIKTPGPKADANLHL